MRAREIGQIVNLASEFRIKKIKLTGGEPLLRDDIVEIIEAIAESNPEEISMTTNGTLLAKIAPELADAGLDRVNISLDTLDETTYERITGKRLLHEVLKGIDAAIASDLKPVKLNMVLLEGVNVHEVERMMAYAFERGIILQLIRLLEVGGKNFVSSSHFEHLEQNLRKRALSIRVRHSMQARKKYILPEGEVEVVKPVHNSEFCMHCTRLRLTPDGYLKPCLMRNDNLVDLLSHIRGGNFEGARRAFIEAIARREPHFKSS